MRNLAYLSNSPQLCVCVGGGMLERVGIFISHLLGFLLWNVSIMAFRCVSLKLDSAWYRNKLPIQAQMNTNHPHLDADIRGPDTALSTWLSFLHLILKITPQGGYIIIPLLYRRKLDLAENLAEQESDLHYSDCMEQSLARGPGSFCLLDLQGLGGHGARILRQARRVLVLLKSTYYGSSWLDATLGLLRFQLEDGGPH